MFIMDCGCKYLPGNWSIDPIIEYCAKHGAVDDLLEAAEALLPDLPTENDMLNYASLNDGRASEYHVACLKLRAAIRRARGEA